MDVTLNVTLEQLNSWDREGIVFVDTRGSISYNYGHIDNAVLLEDVYDEKNIIQPDSSKKYIVYCTYGETSRDIVDKLRKRGYEAYNLTGGYREWHLNKDSGFD